MLGGPAGGVTFSQQGRDQQPAEQQHQQQDRQAALHQQQAQQEPHDRPQPQQPGAQHAQQQDNEGQRPRLQAFVHEDLIVVEHARRVDLKSPPAPVASQPADEAAAAAAAGGAGGKGGTSTEPLTGAEGSASVEPGTARAAAVAAAAAPPGEAAPAPDAVASQWLQDSLDGQADMWVHVSSRGRGHPRPYLLSQVAQQPGGLPADAALAFEQQVWSQVCHISAAVVAAAARRGLVPPDADPRAVLCHLFAFDFAVAAPAEPDRQQGRAAANERRQAQQREAQQQQQQQQRQQEAGKQRQAAGARPRVFLLDANSYPAVASGTMKAVPTAVCTRLIGDVLSLAVLPALGDSGGASQNDFPVLGGFWRVL